MKSKINIYKRFVFLFSICLLSFAPLTLSAQTGKTISGKVIDKENEPLIGVAVVVKGNEAKGTVTDIDGNYSIENISDHDILKFTYIGYQTIEEKAEGKTTINITMMESTNQLNEVVVVGYGSMEKRAVTTSVSSIKGDNLTSGMGGATIATALQGKIPGLTISGTSSPNSSSSFQLRGVASVNAGQGPLVVIDGIPGGDMRSLNQEDIESIDVLKDASAGAIYGTRAAGGVILITTKKAQAGGIKVKYTGEFSLESVRKRPEMLSSSEYIMYGMGQDYGADTDWYKELTRDNPISTRHVINVSGGSKDALVYVTFMNQDQKGIVIGDSRKDYSGRINTNFRLFDGKAEIRTNSEYRQAQRDQRNSADSFNMALGLNPTIPLYDSKQNGGYNVIGNGISGTNFNPVADIELQTYDGKDKWLLTDATLKVNLTDALSAQGTIGYQESQWQLTRYISAFHKESVDGSRSGGGYHGFSKTTRMSAEAYATFNKTFAEKHYINAVAGYSFWDGNQESFNMTNYNFPVEAIGAWDMSSGTYLTDGRATMNSEKKPRERLLSFFGRVNYTFNDRYMLSASLRHEGSSKFGKNHRWGDFWGISGGWRISDEQFVKDLGFVSDFKLRMGYGTTGNNDFDSGLSARRYTSNQMWPTNGTWNPAYGSAVNANPDLKWEVKNEFNFGFDYAFFNNRLYGKFDIYDRQVKDMLYEVNAPMPPMVHKTIMKNIGSLQNRGWEFEIGGDIVNNKNFKYSTTMRFSHNTSKIKKLGDSGYYLDGVTFPSPGNPGTAARLQDGVNIGQYFIYKYAGLDEDGKWLIYDKDNNIVPADGKNAEGKDNLSPLNKHYVGNAMPELIVSWDHTLQYRDFDMTISLRSWINYDIFSQVNMYYGLKNQSQNNVLKDAYSFYGAINDEKILCDLWLTDGTFLKIDAINIGYTANLKKYTRYIDKCRLYLTARDIATFTNSRALNPEVNINGLYPGFEYIKNKDTMYPQTCRFTLGVQLTF